MTPTQAFNAFKENLPPGSKVFVHRFEDQVILQTAWRSGHTVYTVNHMIPDTIKGINLERELAKYLLDIRQSVEVHPTNVPNPDSSNAG